MATQAPIFQPGETRVRNGWEYQRQANGMWTPVRPATAPGAAPAPTATAPSIQIRPADPSAPVELERERVGLLRDRVGLDRDRVALQAAGQPEPLTEAQRNALVERYSMLPGVERQIDNIDRLYREGFAGERGGILGMGSGVNIAGRVLPDFVRPENERLRNAADSMIGAIASMQGATGGEMNSLAELRARFGPMLPQPGDSDATIEDKLTALRAMVADQRRAMLAQLPELASQAPPATAAALPEAGQVRAEEDPEIRVGAGTFNGVPVRELERQGSTPPPSSLGRQLLDSTTNTLAGVGQGLAAIPDAAANAAGAVLAIPADWAGLDFIAENLRRPITIGGAIENVAPTPDDMVGRGVRFASQFTGGAASLPRGLERTLTRAFVDDVPLPPPQPPALPRRSDVMEAANALDIPMMPADVGGATTRMLTAATAQTPGGAAPIVNAARRTVDASGTALRRIARGTGAEPARAEAAGQSAAAGALAYRETSRMDATRLYDRAAELAEGVRVVPQRAVASLNRHIDELKENPAGDEALSFLTTLRDRLAQSSEGVTVQGIRGMRTQLRDRFFSAGLRGTDVERRVMQVVDDASDDVAEALGNAGKAEAAETYRAADAAWRARVDALDNVIMPIIGRQGEKSGEQVFRALQNAAQGNGVRLKRFIGALPAEEVGTVRASLINALGRSSNGRQDAAGEAFSLSEFLTRWNGLDETARAAMFGDEGMTAINRLATVAEHTKAAGSYANSSRTGGVVMTGATAGSALGGLPALAATLGSQYVAGRLLASPAVARGLAKIGNARNPRDAREAIEGLSAVAARNPAIATDIGELQRRLLEAFSASPASRAAAEQDQDIR